MSRAGQAGEVGSVFRCAVATHLAVHGLRSRSVSGLYLPSGVDPIRLDFETQDPTDDIRAIFSDGRRAYVSAKRKITRGRPLIETVDGWVEQASTLGTEDLLVIAGEELVGPIRYLDRALRRYRAGLSMDTRDERDAFHALADLVPEGVRQVVLDRARVLHLPSSTETDTSRDLLAALMDLAVVGAKGQQAVGVLANMFHRQAGAALGSGIEDWVSSLNDAGVTVVEDSGGSAGMREASRMAAITSYYNWVKADAGRVDLSLLAEDLPPVIVDDLLIGMKISVEGERAPDHLLRYLRRWRRMLIIGQPGSGKSVALREIAAHCVTHPGGPVPVRMALPYLIRQGLERLTIDGIINAATVGAVRDDLRPLLIEYLTKEVANGRAIILCDGLDECGTHAPWVVQQLKNILDSLNPGTAFALATRASAQVAAGRLGLPRVELASPSDLSGTVNKVLHACAATRVLESEREAWLSTRRAWLSDAKRQHNHLLEVPLLAMLITLICADASEADLPKGRATLLHRAVQESVRKWEQNRGLMDANQQWSPRLTAGMLLDGFITLGRILDGGTAPSRGDALDALTVMLRDADRWAMPPAQAREVAEQVLRFWDEHVAVFVVNASGELTTRSKVFTEIATAMWTTSCEESQLTEWLSSALAFTDSDGAIALAAGLDTRTVKALLEVGSRGQRESSLLLADLAARSITTLTADELEAMLKQLAAGVVASRDGETPAKRGPKNPPERLPRIWDKTRPRGPWPFVEAACILPIPVEQRYLRARLITESALDESSAVIARALSELTDALMDGQPLGSARAECVNAALATSLPPKTKTVREGRRRFAIVGGGQLSPGLARVALAASRHLDELTEEAPERLLQIAEHASKRSADAIYAELSRVGVDTSNRWGSIFKDMGKWIAAYKEHDGTLLADLATLAEAGPANVNEFWSLTEVGDLLTATGYQEIGVEEFSRAFVHDSEKDRRVWLDSIADAYRINKSAVASQARYLQSVSSDDDTVSDEWFVAATKPLVAPALSSDVDNSLTGPQKLALRANLEADSDWIAWSAAAVLVELTEVPWDWKDLFRRDMSSWPRRRASLLYMVAIISASRDRDELLRRASSSDSADYRSAAVLAIMTSPGLDPDGSIMRALRQDPDASVRPKNARKEAPVPTFWTCDDCRATNGMAVEDCPACDDGVRPEV